MAIATFHINILRAEASGTTDISRSGTRWDRVLLGISIAIMLMGAGVLVGWHAHIRPAIQIFPGLNPMQYNTALCFVALGAAGIGLTKRWRPWLLCTGVFVSLMGGAVLLEYATGASFGIDTFFFHPWTTLAVGPGRMASVSAISFSLAGAALLTIAVRPTGYGTFAIINSVPLSLALTSFIGFIFQITYTLPFSLGLQMALPTAAGFLAYGMAVCGYAWHNAKRGADGLPTWAPGIGVVFLPVLLVGSAALFPRQSWRVAAFEALVGIGGVALVAWAMRRLTTARVVYKGLLMIGIPLLLLLTFVGLVVHGRRQSESAQRWATQSAEVIGAARRLLASIAETESAVRGYVITGDDTFLASHDSSITSITQEAARLVTLVQDNREQAERASTIRDLTVLSLDRLAALVRLMKSGELAQARLDVQRAARVGSMTQVQDEIEVFSREEARLGVERRQVVEALWQRVSWLLVAGASAAILLASLLTISFIGGVSRRLQRLRDNTANLAAGTALGPALTGDDELAEVDRAFRAMAEALDEVTRRERAVIEGTTDGIVIKDLDHRYVMVNRGSAELLGMTIDQVVGASIFDLYEPTTAKRIFDFDNEIFAGGETVTHELVATLPDGLSRTFSSTYAPYRDRHGALVGVISISRDITQQKRAEAALKSGALQSAIFNSANFSSIATDATGVIQIFNVGAERMLGYTAAEVMNTVTPADMSDPEEVIGRAKALSAEFGTPIAAGFEALAFKASRGIEDIYELTYIRKDGSRFPAVVSITALRDAAGVVIGYLLIGTDNTARQLVEEERRKLDQRLRDQHFYTRSLIESNIDAIMATDPRGIITDVNKQTEMLTGCTRDELIGAPFKDHFTDSARAEDGINRVLGEGKVTNYELTSRARDGTLTVVSYNASTFYDRDRTLQGVFASARDVTELKQFEVTLQQKNIELENASRMKSEFLANMSHELRTPLTSIIGFSEVLQDGLIGELTEEQRGFIGDIFGSGKHLLSLINDILDLSKIEAGKMLLDLETVDLSSMLANSLSIIREKAAARRIELVIDDLEGLGSVQADPRKIKQIMYNLLSNAVKFSSDGGRVTVHAARVQRADVGRISGSWRARGFPLDDSEFTDYLEIGVVDTGIGISPEGLDRLFEPFTQVDSGLSRKFEGTGLGLAMVKLLAELHGGTVNVESAVGEGSRFTVWIPARGIAEPALTSTRLRAFPGTGAPLDAPVALVIEDDFKSADLIRLQLEAEGFFVIHAVSAEAALALAVQQPVSLITLDIMLPNMDGWEFLMRIKQVPALRRIPVVIVSIVADRNQGFSLGASAVMQKPISRRELHVTLGELGLLPAARAMAGHVAVV